MRKSLVAAVALAGVLAAEAFAIPARIPQTMARHVVVIDPGHGGEDPGSIKQFNGTPVTEHPYVYDTAKRIERLAAERGGRPYLTVRDTVKEADAPRNWHAQKIFPFTKGTAEYTLNRKTVKAGRDGLVQRVIFGNQIQAKFRGTRAIVTWISVHFDSVERADLMGVRIIAQKEKTKLEDALFRAFEKRKRLRNEFPLVRAGDRDHGMKNLFVLRPLNHIRERVLVELGNFANEADLWRIRDWRVRDEYAQAIVEALENLR